MFYISNRENLDANNTWRKDKNDNGMINFPIDTDLQHQIIVSNGERKSMKMLNTVVYLNAMEGLRFELLKNSKQRRPS